MKPDLIECKVIKKYFSLERAVYIFEGTFQCENNIAGTFEIFFENRRRDAELNTKVEFDNPIVWGKNLSFLFLLKSEINCLIYPVIQNDIEAIKLKEKFMVKPEVKIISFERDCSSIELLASSTYLVTFKIGVEPEKILVVMKNKSGGWLYSIERNSAECISGTIDFSDWVTYVWEHVRDNSELRMALLV